MVKKKLVKLELISPRYTRAELRDHVSEFALYAKYAGYILEDFNVHLSESKLFPLKPDIAERNHKLIMETTLENARILFQITQIYPSFSSWRIKSLTPGIYLAPISIKEPAVKKVAKKKKAVKKAKSKTPAKKKATVKPKSKKTAKKKKVAKKVTKKTVNTVKKPGKPKKKAQKATSKKKKSKTASRRR